MPNYNTLWGARDWAGMRGSGGGGGGLDPIGKSHMIWVDLDLNPLPPLAKFPGSAHGAGWGGGAIYFTGMPNEALPGVLGNRGKRVFISGEGE